jgi:hypothetical protein
MEAFNGPILVSSQCHLVAHRDIPAPQQRLAITLLAAIVRRPGTQQQTRPRYLICRPTRRRCHRRHPLLRRTIMLHNMRDTLRSLQPRPLLELLTRVPQHKQVHSTPNMRRPQSHAYRNVSLLMAMACIRTTKVRTVRLRPGIEADHVVADVHRRRTRRPPGQSQSYSRFTGESGTPTPTAPYIAHNTRPHRNSQLVNRTVGQPHRYNPYAPSGSGPHSSNYSHSASRYPSSS